IRWIHWRVAPYLNVAAPAAFVAMTPPTNAPIKVGAGGYHFPAAASVASSSTRDTPPATRTQSSPMSRMRFMRAVLRTNSPIGVAPPVKDDCAPIGSTVDAD